MLSHNKKFVVHNKKLCCYIIKNMLSHNKKYVGHIIKKYVAQLKILFVKIIHLHL